MDEKPKTVIKRPYGNTSYIKHNINIVDGKVVYDEKFKSFEEEENERLARAYKKMRKDKEQAKEDIKNLREENAKRREEKAKRKAEDEKNTKKYVASLKEKESLTEKSKKPLEIRQTKKVNLFLELKVNDEKKNILLDVINYSLNEREKRVLKDYYGTYYDGLNRKTNSKEAKNNASVVVKKLKISLKEAMAIYDNKIKYRIFLLSFKNELEYVSQDIFKNVSKTILKNAYKKLTVMESRVALDYFNPEKAEELSDEELIIFTNDIFPKLKVYVFNPKGINAYFKAFKEDEQKVLKDVFSIVLNDDKVILKKMFGPKLDGNNIKKLSKQEYIYFRHTIFVRMEKKYKELLKLKGSTDYYISLIKGFSKITLEKHCSIKDEVDKKILLTLLESLNENDKEILFTTNNLDKINRNKLSYERDKILTYLKKSIELLKEVYNDKESYNEVLEKLLNGKQISKVEEQIEMTLSLKIYLEKISISILKDLINYGLKEQEKSFLSNLFDGNYEKSIIANFKTKIAKFNIINGKVNSLVNYLVDLDEEEYESFIIRLKQFPKEDDYNLYNIKDLSTYLGIPLDENLKYIIKNSLEKEERLLLQKRFGLTYEGFLAEEITNNENYKIRVIRDKIIKQYALLKDCSDLEDEKKLELLSKAIEKKPREQKGYSYTSLIEYLGIKEDKKENFYEVMKNIFNEEERLLFQRRFGPLYDGIGVERVTKDENNRVFSYLIPRLKNALNYKPRKQSDDQIKTLKEYLGLNDEDDKNIELAISTLIIEHIESLQKMFGPLYDGVDSKSITHNEKLIVSHTIKPKLLKAIQLINETDEKDLANELDKLTSKNKFGYQFLSLYDVLSLSLDDKKILINAINNIFNKEEISLLQKRFGPLYDGVGITGVPKEENKIIFQYLIPKLNTEIKNISNSNNYKIETLKEYLGLNDEDAKNLELAISTLIIEHIELLQKMFGPLYDGVDSKSITHNEKLIVSHTIKPKLLKAIQLINETDEKDLANELDKLTSKNKFGYQVLSLYDVLSLSLDDKELLINSINEIFNKEEINLFQKRFGPNYDGVGITGVTSEENNLISQCLILRLKWEINKKLGIKKEIGSNYKIKSLFKYLNVEEKDKHILLDIMNILSLEDQQIFQKRFGPLYDGEDVKEITQKEYSRIFRTLISKVKEMFLILSEIPTNQYPETLKKVTYEYQKAKRNEEICTLAENKVPISEISEKFNLLPYSVKRIIRERKEDTPQATFQKVVAVEEVEVREQKVNKEDESITYIKNLLEILEEEKKDLFKNYREKLQYFKHNMALLARKSKIYSQELSSYGFTEKEAAFLLLSTTEGLDLSSSQLMSILKIQKEELKEISLSSTYKVQNLISSELDNYISLLKEMRDNNE